MQVKNSLHILLHFQRASSLGFLSFVSWLTETFVWGVYVLCRLCIVVNNENSHICCFGREAVKLTRSRSLKTREARVVDQCVFWSLASDFIFSLSKRYHVSAYCKSYCTIWVMYTCCCFSFQILLQATEGEKKNTVLEAQVRACVCVYCSFLCRCITCDQFKPCNSKFQVWTKAKRSIY